MRSDPDSLNNSWHLSCMGAWLRSDDVCSWCVLCFTKDSDTRGMSQQYESTILCPDSEAGYTALHELVQEGWEPLFHWFDTKDDHNHMILRRSVMVSMPATKKYGDYVVLDAENI